MVQFYHPSWSVFSLHHFLKLSKCTNTLHITDWIKLPTFVHLQPQYLEFYGLCPQFFKIKKRSYALVPVLTERMSVCYMHEYKFMEAFNPAINSLKPQPGLRLMTLLSLGYIYTSIPIAVLNHSICIQHNITNMILAFYVILITFQPV